MLKKIFIFSFLFLSPGKLYSDVSNSIIATVGNYPITRYDLISEIKLISVISNTKINENNKENIKNIAIKTLVKRAIKRNEIERLKIDNYNKKDLENQVNTVANNLGVNKSDLKLLLERQNISYQNLIKNFETDLKWNSAIFKLYKKKISLNPIEIENKINTELKKITDDKLLLLSEIQVNITKENLETIKKNIKSQINKQGFEDTAKALSISSTANKGGSIGWIKESKLSKLIYENVKNLKNGQIGKPLVIDGVLIFVKKIDEKNEVKNIEIIKKNIVNQEKLKKLEMFSNSHYSDLERKIKVKFL